MPGRTEINADDARLLIGLTAAIEGLIRARRLESDEVAVIARHVTLPGVTLEDTLAGLNARLRDSLPADRS